MGDVLVGFILTVPRPPRLCDHRNACDTAGLAAQLVAVGHVPIAVGMQFSISDQAGVQFSKGVYQYLRTGLPLHRATAGAD